MIRRRTKRHAKRERSKFSRRTEGSGCLDSVSEQCVISSINVARSLPVFVLFLYASCDSCCNRIHEVDRSVLCLLPGLS